MAKAKVKASPKTKSKTKTKKSSKNKKVLNVIKEKAEGAPTDTSTASKKIKKSEWQKKHERFIASIRAAKALHEHLVKGGKIEDFPPPPQPDAVLVECPHCKRKVKESGAIKHIAKCATKSQKKGKSKKGKGGSKTKGKKK